MHKGSTLQILRSNGRHFLRASLLALLGTLLLAASAQADTPVEGGSAPEGLEVGSSGAPEQQPVAPEGQQAPEAQPEGVAETTPAPEVTQEAQGPTGESTAPQEPAPWPSEGTTSPEAGQEPTGGATSPSETAQGGTPEGATGGETQSGETQAVPPSEPTEESQAAPVLPTETVVEAVEEVLPAPGPSPTPELIEEAPVITLPAESLEVSPITSPLQGIEESAQSKTTTTGSEETGGPTGGSSTKPPTPPDASLLDSSMLRADALAPSTPTSLEAPATAAMVTDQIAELSSNEEASRRESTATKQAGRFSCELSALGGDATDNCTVGWLGAPHDLASMLPTSIAVAEVSSLAPDSTSTSPAGGGHDGFVISGPPAAPAPGSAPSGASGAASGGASGAGVSSFLTLAGLLLLGAPRAMRRLRLSCEPWLAGCFVLIPERPG
jgi:hypothetical protein